MKRQNTSKKREKLTQYIDTVTGSHAKKRQSKADSKNAVTEVQLSRLKNLIELVNLLPHLPHWVEGRIETGATASSLCPTLDWRTKGLNEYAVRAELFKIVQGLPPKLQEYIKLFDLEEIKFYCAYLKPQDVIQEIDFTNIDTVNGSFERLREQGRFFNNNWGELFGRVADRDSGKKKMFIFYNNWTEGSDPCFTNAFLARRRLIELLAAQELLFAFSSDNPKGNLLFSARLYRHIEEYSFQAGLGIDENHRIKTHIPELFQILENVDATKIRKCSICLKIFWADHGLMKFCSEKCGTKARVRRWREGYEESYKLQRIKKAEEKETLAKASLHKSQVRNQKGK